MDRNYYCNGKWFVDYASAKKYADSALDLTRRYHVVYTKAEMDSQIKGMIDSIINHEMECGK